VVQLRGWSEPVRVLVLVDFNIAAIDLFLAMDTEGGPWHGGHAPGRDIFPADEAHSAGTPNNSGERAVNFAAGSWNPGQDFEWRVRAYSSSALHRERRMRYCYCFVVDDESFVTVFSEDESGLEESDLTSVLRVLLLDSDVVVGGGVAGAAVVVAAGAAAAAGGAC
jgi:hypothetical protein